MKARMRSPSVLGTPVYERSKPKLSLAGNAPSVDESAKLLNRASPQLAAAVFDCPRIECTRRATSLQWAKKNPLKIKNGRMTISDAPGLGVDLDLDWMAAHRFKGEPVWG